MLDASPASAPGTAPAPLGPERPARAASPLVPVPGRSPRSGLWFRLSRFGMWPLLLGTDLLAVALGVLGPEVLGPEIGVDSPARKTAAFGVLYVLALGQAGLHRSRLSLSVLDDLPVLIGRWLAAAALAVLGQVLWSDAVWRDYVVNWLFLWGAAATGLLTVAFRAIAYAVVRRLRAERVVAHPTLIIGAGRVGQHVAEILRRHPEYGLTPEGFLDGDPHLLQSSAPTVLGGPEDLRRLLAEGRIQCVVVAFSSMRESEMVSVIRACDRYRCELFVVPRLFELHHVEEGMDHAWGMPLVRLHRATYRSRAWRIKRVFDAAVSGLLLILLAPVMVGLAVAVRIDGGPGVLFRQERVGVDGRRFQVLKFRSLRPVDDAEASTTWTVADDARVSRLGRFLRRSSLDELPQLVNVFRGDMSLVGPRPERPHFVHQFRQAYPSYDARHRVPSGLTGWAQVHGLRGDTSIADRARFDNYYIENWSLWLDCKIILRTAAAVVRARGG